MVDRAEKDGKTGTKQNKIFQLISNILFVAFMVVILFFIFITAQSRLTGMEPSILGHRLYIVESGSMEPAIKMGSMIGVKEIEASEIEIGDTVSFYTQNKEAKVTHRIVDIKAGGDEIITRGDANNMDDPNPRSKNEVIGKVVFSIPFIGFIFHYLSKPISIVLIIILGAAWLLIPKILGKGREKNST